MTNPLNSSRIDIAPPLNPRLPLPSRRQMSRFIRHYWLSLSAVTGLVIVGCLPYQVSPSGRVQLLPLSQQRVQIGVAGRVNQVFAQGGDGEIIPAGEVLATLDAPDLQNQRQTLQEQINAQKATLAEAQAERDRLLNLPRPEQVAIYQSAVDVAKQQMSVAEQELTTAKTRAEFSRAEAERYAKLYQAGAVSEQESESFQQQAEVNQTVVTTQAANVQAKNQQLRQEQTQLESVLAGANPDEVQAANAKITAAQAEIRRQIQELQFVADELGRAQLQMPFDGRLVDQQLADKVGTYLEQGDTFAMAESGSSDRLRGQVQVPEVSADQLLPGRSVEVRLLAFPNQPLVGKIIAIEPSASLRSREQTREEVSGATFTAAEPAAGRMLHVIIDLPNPSGLLRPGMTGYAKIEGTTMPVAAAFSRSLIRFIKVEMWSWLP
ncbi:MAG: hypothetical protein DCF15_12995 [Phormidesmis priestleyi]|uniref:CusB-like beta-barrel domain-containing protein n=1 Tax=Phormidesmis priestleyi TaxID=268141 RepID=A0A2W4XBK7_9CYAN|nr:MAG: hypothetical protein DCF15_12995 [Phormidesmis priestleyi]